MANEATIRSSLQIRAGNVAYQSQPSSFQADVTGRKGPSPGAISALTTGTAVSFAELVTPALCRIMNLDATNFITVGVYDGASFFPVIELLPGESYVVRLSRYLNAEFENTGTGTNADANQLMVLADTAECVVLVEAFET